MSPFQGSRLLLLFYNPVTPLGLGQWEILADSCKLLSKNNMNDSTFFVHLIKKDFSIINNH